MSERSPQHYKTGKLRLKPLTLAKLQDLLEKTSSAKECARIRNRIRQLESK